MDRFKTILRNSVSSGDFKIALVVGRVPQVTNIKGESWVKEFGAIDLAWIQSIYNFLFQKEIARIAQGQLTKGVLNIPNLGKVLLIGQRAEESFLNLYLPPEGEARYLKDLAEYEAQPKVAFEPIPPPQAPERLIPAPSFNTRPELSKGRGIDMSAMIVPAAPDVDPEAPVIDSEFDGSATYERQPAQVAPAPPVFSNVYVQEVPPEEEVKIQSFQDDEQPFQANAYTAIPPFVLAGLPSNEEAVVDQFTQPPLLTDYMPGPIEPIMQVRQIPVSPVSEEIQNVSQDWKDQVEAYVPPTASRSTPAEKSAISFANAEGASVSNGQNAIDPILREMIQRRASDVHLVLGQPVIYRIDGSITRMATTPISAEQMTKLVLPIIPATNREEFAKNSDTDFAYQISDVGRFRVNVFRNSRGVAAVMRHIPATILTAEQLKVPAVIMSLCKLNKGLVLVTGPTGSGKSTTLAAMIDNINKNRAEHLLTIEDPIEFVHSQHKCLINQREVGKHTNSFARALKAALREDPDIVLIGEMRDLETIHIAIETAETGHLVFGTLHTTTAVSTIDRIIDQFPSDQQEQIRMMLASSLKAVVAQTLLKKKGGGRVAAHEILILNDAVGNMIREQKGHMINNHMQTQKADGNILLNETLLNLVAAGTVDFEEAWMKSMDKKGFVEMVKRKGIPLTMLDGSLLKSA